jgi:hypothetical protein
MEWRFFVQRSNQTKMSTVEDQTTDAVILSDPDSKAGRLQRACLDLLREHHGNDEIPTNGRFLFYELEQRGVIPKKYDGINPTTGKKFARTPLQDLSDATMHLREHGLVPWWWIEDESRTLNKWRYADNVVSYLRDTIRLARIDLWDGGEPPLLICESRAAAGVLDNLASEYLVPITATGGQCGGHIVNEIVPLLRGKRRVRYIGDYELRGPAEQIEANTKHYIERHTGRHFIGPGEWTRIALTETQVNASARLRGLAIDKLDKRYKPAKPYEAVECEALGQGVLIVRLVRRHLDRLLPEPLDVVRERERQQQEAAQRLLRRRRS